jgi:hypothetical protein
MPESDAVIVDIPRMPANHGVTSNGQGAQGVTAHLPGPLPSTIDANGFK